MSTTPIEPQGDLVMRTLAMPKDTNALGDIFGGWLVSQMDLGAGIVAKKRAKCRVVTVAINQLKFIHPVHVGDMVSCYGSILRVGKTSLNIHVEVWVFHLDDHSIHQKVAEGEFVFVAIDDTGKPQPVDREKNLLPKR